MRGIAIVMMAVGALCMPQWGCSSAPRTAAAGENRIADAEVTIDRFLQADASLRETFFQDAEGWAVFPDVGKGGLWVGGAYGKGVLFSNEGEPLGYCDIAQATVGLQAGGQAFSQIIFFQNEDSLRQFQTGTLELAAQASAVAASADASVSADYDQGVAVFTLSGKGLMAEASIGGQKFDYTPMELVEGK